MRIILYCLELDDFTARKTACEAFLALGITLTDTMNEFTDEIIGILTKAKTDRSKPVREAAIEAFAFYKDIQNPNRR